MTVPTKNQDVDLSPDDMKFILRNYGPMTAKQIGDKIGRSTDFVRRFVKRYDEGRGAR
jgi:transposase